MSFLSNISTLFTCCFNSSATFTPSALILVHFSSLFPLSSPLFFNNASKSSISLNAWSSSVRSLSNATCFSCSATDFTSNPCNRASRCINSFCAPSCCSANPFSFSSIRTFSSSILRIAWLSFHGFTQLCFSSNDCIARRLLAIASSAARSSLTNFIALACHSIAVRSAISSSSSSLPWASFAVSFCSNSPLCSSVRHPNCSICSRTRSRSFLKSLYRLKMTVEICEKCSVWVSSSRSVDFSSDLASRKAAKSPCAY